MRSKINDVLLFILAVLIVACQSNKPKQGVGSYQIKGSADKVEIPFEFNGMNLMVKARMNDINIKLQIDN